MPTPDPRPIDDDFVQPESLESWLESLVSLVLATDASTRTDSPVVEEIELPHQPDQH